ncbi:hypothetical protein BH09MYX1_BH09MYX1_66640 [soil metagenome]
MSRVRLLSALVVLAGGASLAFAACDGTGAYVYYGREYDQPRDCLGQVEALDVLSGTDPGFGCAARCIVVKDVDGSSYLYGTTQCGPTPPGANAQEGDPRCAAVRAAVLSLNLCMPDSGIKEAGVDAAADAPDDVTLAADAAQDALGVTDAAQDATDAAAD